VPTYSFTVVLNRRPTDAELDRLLAGEHFDDAMFGMEYGVPVAEFDREDVGLANAIVSAVGHLDASGLTALRIIDGDLVTLADIAARIGQSRESLRRYATGSRGPGEFPPPVNPSRDGATFYRWSEVAPWLRMHLGLEVSDNDAVLVAANLLLQARRFDGLASEMAVLRGLLAA
jgi:hypothetical protein